MTSPHISNLELLYLTVEGRIVGIRSSIRPRSGSHLTVEGRIVGIRSSIRPRSGSHLYRRDIRRGEKEAGVSYGALT